MQETNFQISPTERKPFENGKLSTEVLKEKLKLVVVGGVRENSSKSQRIAKTRIFTMEGTEISDPEVLNANIEIPTEIQKNILYPEQSQEQVLGGPTNPRSLENQGTFERSQRMDSGIPD